MSAGDAIKQSFQEIVLDPVFHSERANRIKFLPEEIYGKR